MYDVMPEGLFLEEDVGLLSMDTVQKDSHQHDYHTLDWGGAPQLQQQKGGQLVPQMTSGDNIYLRLASVPGTILMVI